MQSFFIGVGAVLASALPWILTNLIGVSGHSGTGIPWSVEPAFYLGAAVFLGAVLWTILRTPEYPPSDPEAFARQKAEVRGLSRSAKIILSEIGNMPSVMRQLAWVQIFTWLGLFCMWLYFPVAVARNIFNAPDETSPLYLDGIEWAGLCFAFYSAVCFLFAFALAPMATRLGKRWTHALCLMAGGAGLLSVGWIDDPRLLFLSMTGVGIAWASILSMPYSILASALPAAKMGTFMGIFNFFIVLPEIVASLGFGFVMHYLLDNNRMAAVLIGGICLFIAAALMARVQENSVSQPA